MCSIYSGKLKIRVFSHNFDINIIFIAIHDGQGEEVQTFRRGFECVSDAIPAVTMVTDYLVKLHLPNWWLAFGQNNVECHDWLSGL